MNRSSQNWWDLLSDVHVGRRDFADFFDAAYCDLYAFFCRRGVQHADAEDLVSEVALKVFKGLRTLQPDREPSRAWVYTIARHTWIDLVRKLLRRPPEVGLDALETDKACLGPDVQWVHEMLDRLDNENRQLLTRRFLDGCTLQDIADDIGCAPSTVHNRIKSAIEKLRTIAEDFEGS